MKIFEISKTTKTFRYFEILNSILASNSKRFKLFYAILKIRRFEIFRYYSMIFDSNKIVILSRSTNVMYINNR